ncbi:MAG: hypothetical protein H6813_06790 [Phycisphaeraceae bacterium]|nr:hypothetical protein [Phycisphaeraceae bacterium]MCB9848641.1 hypothetical protein [Phycisphaeraceae bacterium]
MDSNKTTICAKPAGAVNRLIRTLLIPFAAMIVAATGIDSAAEPDALGAPPGAPQAPASIAISWTDANCNGCHKVKADFSHPVGVQLKPGMRTELPLANGRVSCLTCHDGDQSASHARARTEHSPMLRGNLAPAALCVSCHRDSPFSSTGGHSIAVDKAHLVWPDDSRQDDRPGVIAAGLDRESSSCLECHDGALATGVGGSHDGGARFGGSLATEHPIGIPFAQRSGKPREGMARMVHPGSLDDRIRLFDGNIGCGSCHSVYAKNPSKLVMDNSGSRLCLSCHDG